MQPGRRIEHYILIEQVGQGGQAAVWSAEDEQLKRTVAIKTINLSAAPEAMGSVEEQARRFKNEARIIADLEHPYILPIYTYGQDGDWLYIVMRYMAGGTLRKLIQQEPLDLSRVTALAAPLADALDLAHLKRIVHRDIKSVNVLLDTQKRPYLADFGLSVTAGDSAEQSGSGTLAYMSPEQLRSLPGDHRSDLYAFGILLYEMLTGNVPTINDQHWNLVQVMSGAPLPTSPNVSYEALEVLQRTTALDPEDRYQSAQEIVEALRATLEPASSETLVIDLDTDFMLLPITDPALLALNKANDLFDTALTDWADGAGRFRLYADDFKYINSFYSSSESWNLTLDDAARRLLLRAALEHGYKLEAWWQAVASPAERRAVALQTLTSELASARLRAIEYLTLIADSEPPAIPIRVAAIIAKDPDAEVRQAGVILLEERASRASAWRPAAYDTGIDGTLSALAAHDLDADVAESAARAIGRLRSTSAVLDLSRQAVNGDLGASRALIHVRDEADAFPAGVPANVRRRVFIALSGRQLLVRELLTRYASAELASVIGLGVYEYVQYNQDTGGVLVTQAIGNGFAVGLAYGAVLSVGIVLASEPARLLRAWSTLSRIAVSILSGGLICALLFLLYRTYYSNITDPPDLPWIIGSSFVFAAGFAIASGITKNPLIWALGGALGIFAGLYISFTAYQLGWAADTLLYLGAPAAAPDTLSRSIGLGLWLAVTLGSIPFLPEWLRLLTRSIRKQTS